MRYFPNEQRQTAARKEKAKESKTEQVAFCASTLTTHARLWSMGPGSARPLQTPTKPNRDLFVRRIAGNVNKRKVM
jgi:hypothetical protein